MSALSTLMESALNLATRSSTSSSATFRPLDENTRSFLYHVQPRAAQGMLNSDYSCYRVTPSVAVESFGRSPHPKLYWGTKKTLLLSYTSMKEAVVKHPDVDIVVNFASSRSLYSSTLECMTPNSRLSL
ncbi:hypothetical protein JOM56_013281 [Amanita muscaria]